MDKINRNCAFGGAVKRFSYTGLHPSFISPSHVANSTIGPGYYGINVKQECVYKKETGPYHWKTEMDNFSKQAGLTRNTTFKQQREEQRKGLGPAVHDINPDLFKKKDFSVTEGNIFGRGLRFKEVKETGIPPGTYYKGLLGRSSLEVHQLTKVPPFEWDGMKNRFTVQEPSYKLAPNRYNPVDLKSLETLLNKVTSLRGPFDLLTGPRDETTIKNHFARPKSCAPDVYYVIPSDLDRLLTSKCKSKMGLFRKSKRFPKYPGSRMLMTDISTCYKDPEHPGPADYNPHVSKPVKPSQHPFNSSNFKTRSVLKWNNLPGPGRYFLQEYRRKKPRPSCVFLNTNQRV